MALLGSYMCKSVHWDLHHHEIYPEQFVGQEPLDPTPNQRVWEMFRWKVVSDAAQFDGATIDAVRAHLRPQRLMEWDWKCIIIDEEVFELLKGLPVPKDDEEDTAVAWVKAVNLRWKGPEDSEYPRYEG